jgi:hypothetical protein
MTANCDVCYETDQILTAAEKDLYRKEWAGIDFYNEICFPCWTAAMDLR